MTAVHGRVTAFLVNEFDVTTNLNQVTHSNQRAADNADHFGINSKAYVAGLSESKMGIEGWFDVDLNGATDLLETKIETDVVALGLLAQTGIKLGGPVKFGEGILTQFEVNTKIDGVGQIKAEMQANKAFPSGIILAAAKSIATATTTNEASQVRAALTATGGRAQLHVVGNASNGATVVKVQHSVDGSTWADLITFTSVPSSTKTSELKALANGTTVNRYVRATATTAGTGAVVYTVAFARR